MLIITVFVKNAQASTLISGLSAATIIALAVFSVPSAEPLRQKKLLQSFPEFVNYLLKKLANDQAITKMDPTILRYTHPSSMTPMRYADGLYAKACKVADFYDEYPSNHIFIDGVDSTIYYSLPEYWATNSRRSH